MLEMFKDDKTGQWSLGRVSAAVVLVGCCLWSGYLSGKTGAFVDVPTNWALIICGLYGINKFASSFGKKGDD